jgi:hypothetical protein
LPARRAADLETMTEKKVVSDGTRSLELYKLVGNGHNPYILIGYLPAEKILLYGDMYNPPPGSDPRDLARTNEYADNLYDNIVNRFQLDVQTIAPIHGLPVPFDNLKKAIGKMRELKQRDRGAVSAAPSTVASTGRSHRRPRLTRQRLKRPSSGRRHYARRPELHSWNESKEPALVQYRRGPRDHGMSCTLVRRLPVQRPAQARPRA